jgi:hypothetical protein
VKRIAVLQCKTQRTIYEALESAKELVGNEGDAY